MRTTLTFIWLPILVLFLAASGCSRAQGLVGLWQTEPLHVEVPGRTNVGESYQTVEFLKDGSFKMGSTITTDGKKQTMTFFTGTYALIDTNHVQLEIVPNQAPPDMKITSLATVSIDGDELEMSKLITSVIPETQKYRRVKR